MLTDEEYLIYCKDVQLSPQACQVISNIRASEPVQRFSGKGNNVAVSYASRKMKRTIRQRRTLELPGYMNTSTTRMF
jgi:hypothetical protein